MLIVCESNYLVGQYSTWGFKSITYLAYVQNNNSFSIQASSDNIHYSHRLDSPQCHMCLLDTNKKKIRSNLLNVQLVTSSWFRMHDSMMHNVHDSNSLSNGIRYDNLVQIPETRAQFVILVNIRVSWINAYQSGWWADMLEYTGTVASTKRGTKASDYLIVNAFCAWNQFTFVRSPVSTRRQYRSFICWH